MLKQQACCSAVSLLHRAWHHCGSKLSLNWQCDTSVLFWQFGRALGSASGSELPELGTVNTCKSSSLQDEVGQVKHMQYQQPLLDVQMFNEG